MTSFFDQQCGHPVYPFGERTICFCVPDKFRVNVPKFCICHQGAYINTIGLDVAGWVLQIFGVVPRRDRETEDEVWLLILTASAILPAELSSCLPESPCIAACFTRHRGLFGEFCEQPAAYVQEMYCVCLVNWDAWPPRIRDCFPVGVQNPGDDDGEMDKPESDTDDKVEQVKGGGGQAQAHPIEATGVLGPWP